MTATLFCSTHTFAQETLEDINVTTSNKTSESIANSTSNITVLGAEEIEENGYQTVAQALNSIAGISVETAGGLGQQNSFFLRGADSGSVLVLLDGMRLNDPSTTNGTALLESLATDNIEQIEIVQGAQSSIWGSNASAGVINIITKKAKEGVHGLVGLQYGSYATKGTDVALSYKDKKLTAQVLASYLDTQSFSALSPASAENDGYTNKNLNLKLGYVFNANNSINLSYNTTKTKTEYDNPFSEKKANDDYSHADSKQKNLALVYRYEVENYSATVRASKGVYDRNYFSISSFGEGTNVYKATLKEYSFINAYTYTQGKAIVGFEYKNIDGFNQYNAFAKSQADYSNKAIFLSNTYHVNNDTLLETNLRYDDYDAFNNETTYKIGLKHYHHFLEGFVTSANYHTGYDAPSAYALANSVAGTMLKPSYSKGFDITAKYKELLTLSYFNTKTKDSIDYDMNRYGYFNVLGKSKFSGLEVSSTVNIDSLDLMLSANYTHLFTFEKEDKSALLRRAKDVLNVTLNKYVDNNTYFGVTAQYIGDRIDTNGAYPASKVSTGNYTVYNANFGTKLFNNMEVSLHVKNIFNKTYQSIYAYASSDREAYAKIHYRF